MSMWQEQQRLLESNLAEVKKWPTASVNRHVRGVIEHRDAHPVAAQERSSTSRNARDPKPK